MSSEGIHSSHESIPPAAGAAQAHDPRPALADAEREKADLSARIDRIAENRGAASPGTVVDAGTDDISAHGGWRPGGSF
jgi:hypothetical protein